MPPARDPRKTRKSSGSRSRKPAPSKGAKRPSRSTASKGKRSSKRRGSWSVPFLPLTALWLVAAVVLSGLIFWGQENDHQKNLLPPVASSAHSSGGDRTHMASLDPQGAKPQGRAEPTKRKENSASKAEMHPANPSTPKASAVSETREKTQGEKYERRGGIDPSTYATGTVGDRVAPVKNPEASSNRRASTPAQSQLGNDGSPKHPVSPPVPIPPDPCTSERRTNPPGSSPHGPPAETQDSHAASASTPPFETSHWACCHRHRRLWAGFKDGQGIS